MTGLRLKDVVEAALPPSAAAPLPLSRESPVAAGACASSTFAADASNFAADSANVFLTLLISERKEATRAATRAPR